ncbi:DUF362 domain-containing protein [Aminipila terrae]|uniref:(4Fe-4S)-binding protein n=1 Tax=Aminipila terrae TaxID=2697030 RepID=A0A6P1MII6_9FIRM|nr:4Fe-4S binding protein [Aminipila terrae]QHI73551.1 (4Fe-4S)-binding protein [Aminipila terrae]
METKEVFEILKNDIHSTVFAVVDEKGLPKTCVIDVMLCDENSIYFITAKGKKFYERLVDKGYVAISGMTGNDTLSMIAVSVYGKVRNVGTGLLPRIFKENSYMEKIYKNEASRTALTIFQLYTGEGEIFDLTQIPPVRKAFSFGDCEVSPVGYSINENCTGCRKCIQKCPVECIEQCGKRFTIKTDNCIRCGNCYESCDFRAVDKR